VEEKNFSLKKNQGNHLLKLERERRGWSLSYVATLINCPDPHSIGRWERNKCFPSPRYRQALCELYNKDAKELGFLKDKSDGANEEPLDHVYSKQLSNQRSLARPDNYFFFNVKLPRVDEFYGRKIEREILLNRTSNKSSTSIVGPRRIGKTWLLEYLLLDAREQLGNCFRIGYLDAMMPSCSTIAGFTIKAAKELGFSLSTEQAQTGLAILEDVVEALRAKGMHAVLCIDEFEGLGNRQEFDLNFFASLRALAQGNLSLVIASKRPLIDIVGDYGDTSGFFNVFEQLTLEPFDDEEANDFVTTKSSYADFTDQEQAALLKYGQLANEQWLPIRLQLAGKMLLEDKTARAKEDSQHYQPDGQEHWERFAQRLEKKYRGVIIR
jgi:transcriptional regulator with XRE-family HTH domain